MLRAIVNICYREFFMRCLLLLINPLHSRTRLTQIRTWWLLFNYLMKTIDYSS
uniref:Uncharacterized protein n=1 Tax=Oryza sativa subsp. japonica TaxID=39947 RepID=Q5VPA1_ORYSJ|nr:hypothetical protein [Oryza sativa Japonica Group]